MSNKNVLAACKLRVTFNRNLPCCGHVHKTNSGYKYLTDILSSLLYVCVRHSVLWYKFMHIHMKGTLWEVQQYFWNFSATWYVHFCNWHIILVSLDLKLIWCGFIAWTCEETRWCLLNYKIFTSYTHCSSTWCQS